MLVQLMTMTAIGGATSQTISPEHAGRSKPTWFASRPPRELGSSLRFGGGRGRAASTGPRRLGGCVGRPIVPGALSQAAVGQLEDVSDRGGAGWLRSVLGFGAPGRQIVGGMACPLDARLGPFRILALGGRLQDVRGGKGSGRLLFGPASFTRPSAGATARVVGFDLRFDYWLGFLRRLSWFGLLSLLVLPRSPGGVLGSRLRVISWPGLAIARR